MPKLKEDAVERTSFEEVAMSLQARLHAISVLVQEERAGDEWIGARNDRNLLDTVVELVEQCVDILEFSKAIAAEATARR